MNFLIINDIFHCGFVQKCHKFLKIILQFMETVDKGDKNNVVLGEDRGKTDMNHRKKTKIVAAVSVAAGLALLYFGLAFYFQSHFAFRTDINHLDVSGCGVKKVERRLEKEMKSYRLSLKPRTGEREEIRGESIELKPVFRREIDEMLDRQNAFAWPYYLVRGQRFVSEAVVEYDEGKLREEIGRLFMMKSAEQKESRDAYISDYSRDGYQIIEEEYGTKIDAEAFEKAVREAVLGLDEELVMDKAGCYIDPKITKEDEGLRSACDTLNKYTKLTITYNVGDKREILDGEIIHRWLSVSKGKKVRIDEAQIADYVSELARKYNTAFRSRTLRTSYGKEIAIVGGDYGWKVDKDAEREMILKDLNAGESVERELVYAQTANSHGPNDYGDTYVEINLTAQHLFFYKDGELLVESDFVSGNIAKSHATPVGAYSLTYKQKDATLRGEDYESKVSYWMPYCGDVGMHDASWRSSFGGSIYKRNGSHGCVNLPASAAKTIFENIEAGYPVLVYELSGTESAKGLAQDRAASVDDLISAIGEVTLDAQPKISAARAAFDALGEQEKGYVRKLDVLTAAEAAFAALQQEAANQATQAQGEAQAVIDKINAIGKVTEDDKAAIRDARKSYDALSEMAKAYVTNYAVLQEAEEAYKALTES